MAIRGTKRKEPASPLSSHHDTDSVTKSPSAVIEDPTRDIPEENILVDVSKEQWDPTRVDGNDNSGHHDDGLNTKDTNASRVNANTATKDHESNITLSQGTTEIHAPQIPPFFPGEPSLATIDQQQQYHLLEFWDWMNRWNIYQHSLAHYWRERYNDPFARKYHELVIYKQLYGDCNVPADYVADDETLGSWVKRMRKEWSAGRLDSGKVEQLRSLGFDFERGEDKP